jgi:UDP-N-acetylglucosamine--N-acetylmuramyl-(pentapeptide) pyrophosphoryl-undecaprenol N-acetylglucosamine transferase
MTRREPRHANPAGHGRRHRRPHHAGARGGGSLRARGWRVVWLGTRAGMEARICAVERGFEMAWVRSRGVRGKGLLRKALLPAICWSRSGRRARAIFRVRPDVVLGMGGYVAFPGGMMASAARQAAGDPRAECHRRADQPRARLPRRPRADSAAAFPERAAAALAASRRNGSAIRCAPDIARLPRPAERFAGRSGALRLLVVGGSLGAQALNELVPQALAHAGADQRPQVVHQSGAKHLDALRANYAAAGVRRGARLHRRHGGALRRADLVICRAGALTVAELAAPACAACWCPSRCGGRPPDRATPLPRRAGAAWLIQQRDLTPQRWPTGSAAHRAKLLTWPSGRARWPSRCHAARRRRSAWSSAMKHKVRASISSASAAPA